jgi:hypothetical protein
MDRGRASKARKAKAACVHLALELLHDVQESIVNIWVVVKLDLAYQTERISTFFGTRSSPKSTWKKTRMKQAIFLSFDEIRRDDEEEAL